MEDNASRAAGAFAAGQHVTHAIFGHGHVIAGDGAGLGLCTVRFADGREITIADPRQYLAAVMPPRTAAPARAAAAGDDLPPFEVLWLPLADLKHSPERGQRPISPQRVRRLAREFELDLAGALCVNICTDGSGIWIMDGGHRAEAMRQVGYERAYCHAWRVTAQEEARLFRRLNSLRTSVRALSLFHARLREGDPDARALESVVCACGYHIATETDRTQDLGAVTCVALLERLYRSRGQGTKSHQARAATPERVQACLSVLAQTWGHRHGAVSEPMVTAVDVLLRCYDASLDRARFAERLGGADPYLLVRRARDQRRQLERSREWCLANELRQRYNEHLRSGRRLPALPEDLNEL